MLLEGTTLILLQVTFIKIRSLFGISLTNLNLPIPAPEHGSDLVASDCTKVSLFNNYFVSNEDMWPAISLSHFVLDNFKLSESEVVEKLKMLNVHKACGPDQMCRCWTA